MPNKYLCKKGDTFVRECELHPTARRLHWVNVTNDSCVDKMMMMMMCLDPCCYNLIQCCLNWWTWYISVLRETHQIVDVLLQTCSKNNLVFLYNTYNKNILITVKAVLGLFYRHRTNHKKRIRREYKMQNYFTCREVSTSSSESSNLLHNRLLIWMESESDGNLAQKISAHQHLEM